MKNIPKLLLGLSLIITTSNTALSAASATKQDADDPITIKRKSWAKSGIILANEEGFDPIVDFDPTPDEALMQHAAEIEKVYIGTISSDTLERLKCLTKLKFIMYHGEWPEEVAQFTFPSIGRHLELSKPLYEDLRSESTVSVTADRKAGLYRESFCTRGEWRHNRWLLDAND